MPPKKFSNKRSMKKFNKRLICEPAMLYLFVSILGLLLLGVQNMSANDGTFCIASYECSAVSKTTAFVLQLFYILFWTWVLNSMCKYGYRNVSWVIVLLPLFMYVAIISALVSNGVFYIVVEEGMKNKK